MNTANLQPVTADSPAQGKAAVILQRVSGWSLVTKLALLTGLWLVISVVFAVQIYALGVMPWATATTLALMDWGPWIVFSPLVIWLAWRLPLAPKTWRWTLPAHLLTCLVTVLLMEALTFSLAGPPEQYFRPRPPLAEGPPPEPPAERPRPEPPDRPFEGERNPFGFLLMRLLERARVAVPVYWMLVAAAHAISHQRRSLERERRALQAEARLAEARLEALQAQFKPHFLFNTLNTMAQLVYENPAGAEEMITSLSELLRTVLAVQQRREVPLAEEIAFIERYCAIQRVRFADRLQVRYEIEPAARAAVVPALLLQPLVENAIIHGIAPEPAPGTVFLRARVAGERLYLEVADTGHGWRGGPPDDGPALNFKEGVGLANTRARLASLYGLQHVFTLARADEGGVAVRMELPLRLPAT
jgi:signal transduction histidine kinase